MQNSLIVVSDQPPGHVVSKLVSQSDSWLRQVELLGKDEKDQQNAGGHPWSLAEGVESTLLLFNHSDTPQYFNVLISTGSTPWQKAYKLTPMQTTAISIRQLVGDRVKDEHGHILPMDIQSGEIGWLTADPAKGKGRLLQSNSDIAMARSFSCGSYDVLCGSAFFGNTMTFPFGQTVDFASVEGKLCLACHPTQCGGVPDRYVTSGFNYSWSSSYPSIASVSGPATNYTVNLYGAGAGTTPVNYTISNGSCQTGGGNPANVQIPKDSRIVSNYTNGNNLMCTQNGQGGWYRKVKRIVTDQFGGDIKIDGQTVTELVTVSAVNDMKLPTGSTSASATTAGGGYFADTYAFCSPACPASSGQSDLTQQYFDVLPSSPTRFNLNYVNLVFKCTGITANGK